MKYETLVGINWTPPGSNKERRAEAGTIVGADEFKPASVKAFLDMGAICPAKESVKGEPAGKGSGLKVGKDDDGGEG